MKKFIFSAVAVMAFSMSSMANTIEIEEYPVTDIVGECGERGRDAYNAASAFGASDEVAADISIMVTIDCLIQLQ
ncbi:MAG: hypothetical protein Q8K02_10370 [Flavobacterium sp.]|nr:hypothetical protein [Flavobacterium sp.]